MIDCSTAVELQNDHEAKEEEKSRRGIQEQGCKVEGLSIASPSRSISLNFLFISHAHMDHIFTLLALHIWRYSKNKFQPLKEKQKENQKPQKRKWLKASNGDKTLKGKRRGPSDESRVS